MSEDTLICASPFTIDLACSLSLKCIIQECPVDSAPCPFGYDVNDSKLCNRITPSRWVKVLKERVV